MFSTPPYLEFQGCLNIPIRRRLCSCFSWRADSLMRLEMIFYLILYYLLQMRMTEWGESIMSSQKIFRSVRMYDMCNEDDQKICESFTHICSILSSQILKKQKQELTRQTYHSVHSKFLTRCAPSFSIKKKGFIVDFKRLNL